MVSTVQQSFLALLIPFLLTPTIAQASVPTTVNTATVNTATELGPAVEPMVDLGPMPPTPSAEAAGDPDQWDTPDRSEQLLERPNTYTLVPGDRVNVAISTVPEFSGVYQLMVDGRITLPVIGPLDIQGMTEPEAALHIAKHYAAAKVLVKPTITVILAEMSNLHVAILGEVNRPGSYVITPKNGELPKLTQIIEQAGGITQQTDLRSIQIQRPLRSGRFRLVRTSLWQLLVQGDLSQDLAIRDGDTITLNTAENMSLDVAKLVARSNVAGQEIAVNLVGEVFSPGIQKITVGTSLNQVLLTAGGFTGQAKKKSIELMRLNANGTISRQKIAIDYGQPVGSERNPVLQNQDVILVDRNLGARVTDKIGNILSPINSVLSLFNLFSPFVPKSR
jgi:polysaccharide biosynthesis/export protein